MAEITDEELADAIDALYAYDTGSVDSGTHDPRLKARVREALQVPGGMARAWRLIVHLNLSPEGRVCGYGWEDLGHQAEWCEEIAESNFMLDDILGKP